MNGIPSRSSMLMMSTEKNSRSIFSDLIIIPRLLQSAISPETTSRSVSPLLTSRAARNALESATMQFAARQSLYDPTCRTDQVFVDCNVHRLPACRASSCARCGLSPPGTALTCSRTGYGVSCQAATCPCPSRRPGRWTMQSLRIRCACTCQTSKKVDRSVQGVVPV